MCEILCVAVTPVKLHVKNGLFIVFCFANELQQQPGIICHLAFGADKDGGCLNEGLD